MPVRELKEGLKQLQDTLPHVDCRPNGLEEHNLADLEPVCLASTFTHSDAPNCAKWLCRSCFFRWAESRSTWVALTFCI